MATKQLQNIRLLKVGKEAYLSIEQILGIFTADSTMIKNLLSILPPEKILNLCGREKRVSAVLLSDNLLVLSPITTKTLYTNFNNSTSKDLDE